MKKIILAAGLLLLAGAILPVKTLAAELDLVSGLNNYTVGQTISVRIVVNPGGSPYDTVSASGTFPANLLELQSFAANPSFSTMSPDNSFDNAGGTFSFGGGIPGGSSQTADLGTIVFKVKDAGNAMVSLTGDSAIINAGQVIPSSNGSVNFSLSAPAPAPKPAIKPAATTKPAVKPAPKPIIKNNPAPSPTPSPATADLSIPVVASNPQVNNFYYAYMAEWATSLIAAIAVIWSVASYFRSRKIKNRENKIHKFEDDFKF